MNINPNRPDRHFLFDEAQTQLQMVPLAQVLTPSPSGSTGPLVQAAGQIWPMRELGFVGYTAAAGQLYPHGF